MKILLKEALGYAVASGCALVVDMAVLATLVHYFGWWYLAAATVSFLSGVLVAYALSVKLVFKQRRLRDRRTEFVSFVAIGTLGLALNAAVIFVAVKYFGLYYLVAKCVAAGFTFICNFISRRQLLFVQRSPAKEFN
jgi:putative flippase GtrA